MTDSYQFGERMGKDVSGRKLPPAADGVALVMYHAAREVSRQYKCRFSLWMVPSQVRENWVELWCSSSRWWTDVTKRFLTVVVFDEGGGVSGHVSVREPRDIDFSDLETFRVALAEFFRSPECGRVMRNVLDFGGRK